MFVEEMRQRTKTMALRAIRLAEALPRRPSAVAIRSQLIRSSMSVAANYRAAQRGRSKREFFSKLCVAVEECDETLFWLEMTVDIGLLPPERVNPLLSETNEILRVLSAARATTKHQLSPK
jgi:four helix bundle protein